MQALIKQITTTNLTMENFNTWSESDCAEGESNTDESTEPMNYDGRVLIIGCGSIGLGIIPLLLRHIKFSNNNNPISIWTAEDREQVAIDAGKKFNIPVHVGRLTETNYRNHLEQFHLQEGDFILNLSVDVSSIDLMRWCQPQGILYLDTCIEPWPGTYSNPDLSVSKRSNYALREEALRVARNFPRDSPTAIITHGANPGMVSHFVKQALLNIAESVPHTAPIAVPTTRTCWAELGKSLGVQAIHISERDTQYTNIPREANDFYNTWSVDGFLSEGVQPAEMGWGTHEKSLPHDGAKHDFGCGAAIYLNRPGAGTRVRSWTPRGGPHLGFLITHSEAISIADYFTAKRGEEVVWRPTVHYAYRPCDTAVLALEELAVQRWDAEFFTNKKVMVDEIVDGNDDLGVLIMGTFPARIEGSNVIPAKPYAYWYGSELNSKVAFSRAEYNSATTLQVTSCILAGFMWAIKNPRAGVLEPEELPFDEILEVMEPYISPINGVFTDWTPLEGRGKLFPESVDRSDPWQFKNLRFE
jgi:homospermidine synthase